MGGWVDQVDQVDQLTQDPAAKPRMRRQHVATGREPAVRI
jgi:hypothetical protein